MYYCVLFDQFRVQMVCIAAGILFVTYVNVRNRETWCSPIHILNEALAFEGDTSRFNHISLAIPYLKRQNRRILTVIDEAQKYSVKNGSPRFDWATDCFQQVYALGMARGSPCFLCGSTKLKCLAWPTQT